MSYEPCAMSWIQALGAKNGIDLLANQMVYGYLPRLS
jgi:hypothetical protein